MTFVREFGLIHNGSDGDRFIRLVKWEERWVPAGDDTEAKHLLPVAWEYRVLGGRAVPVAITELAVRQWRTTWPREAPTEGEALRRERIRLLRRATHVDPALGEAEPDWSAGPVAAA